MSLNLYLIIVAAGALVWLWRRLSSSNQGPDLPLVEMEGEFSQARYASELRDLLSKGYVMYTKQGQAFCVRNPSMGQRPIVILPRKYIDEIKAAPQTKFSLPLYIDQSGGLLGKKGPFISEAVQHVARQDLNRALNNIVGSLHDSCVAAFKKEMAPSSDWTPVFVFQKIRNIFSLVSVRVLVGPEMDLDKWLALSTEYIDATIKALGGVKAKYPPRLLWLSRYLNSDVKRVIELQRQGAELLRPILEGRLAERDRNSQSQAPAAIHEDAVQWFLDESQAKGKTLTPEELCLNIFVLMFASIHSASSTALWVLFDMLDYPDSVMEIQEEISRVRTVHPSWTRQALAELELLDSFMRESFRLHSFTETTVTRLVVKGHRFKDGLSLPAGSLIACLSHQLSLDADIHPDPTTFDSKRHLRKRQEIDASRYHFASTSEDTLNWGAGSHACPGRFFARDIIKLILVHMLTNYEFEYPDNGKKRRGPDMPRNFSTMPDVTAQVLFREKKFL